MLNDKFDIRDLDDEDPENADNMRQYVKECRRCFEVTLIGEDYRASGKPASHFLHDTTICTDCKTEMLEEEGYRWENEM